MTTQLPCRERLNQIANFHSSMALPPSHDEIEAMARALLAAYEQEPVAAIKSSQYLHGFYHAYAEWLKSGSDGRFSCTGGLCANLFDYCEREGIDSDKVLNEMHAQFVSAGLKEKLPFNACSTDFDVESTDGECHLNEERRRWVLARIADGVKTAPVPAVQPVMFIDGDISSEDADKLAKVIREFNEEDERPLAKMARIIRENPHPTNECDMPRSEQVTAVPVISDEVIDRIVIPLNADGLDEEQYHCEWHLYHDRERIRKALREYFAAPPIPTEIPTALPDEMTIKDACKFVQDMRIFDDVVVIVMRTWNACRAAMLNGGKS